MKNHFYLFFIFLFSLSLCFCQTTRQPIFNEDAIPLTTNASFGISYFQEPSLKVGQQISVSNSYGTTVLRMTSRGPQLLKDNVIVWGSVLLKESNEMVLQLFSQGDLCVKANSSVSNSQTLWCINTSGLGGSFINILPAGSYNREWGIVLQDQNGQMVWARFGGQIISDNSYYLIPGSYLSQNNVNTRKYITNGRDYLVLNSGGHSIALYMNYHPLSFSYQSSLKLTNSSTTSVVSNGLANGEGLEPVWYQDQEKFSNDFVWSFQNNSFCVSHPDSVQNAFCTYPSGSKYALLPLSNIEIQIDATTWTWITLSNLKNKVYTAHSRPLPLFNTDRIPLTPNGSWKNGAPSKGLGSSLKVGNLKLTFDSNGLALFFKGISVWSPISFYPPKESMILSFGDDGNICIVTQTTTEFCLYSNGFGATDLNLLPEGSYGREWGMVLQNSVGQMVWGIWGNPVSATLTPYPLIPGSFIEIGKSVNNFITNGLDYLGVNKNGNALSLYTNKDPNSFVNPFYHLKTPDWIYGSSSINGSTFSFQSDSNLCLIQNGQSIWCNNIFNQKYLVLPIGKSNLLPIGSWGWVTLNSEKQVSYAVAESLFPVFDTKKIPLSFDGYINANVSKLYPLGMVLSVGKTIFNMTENGPILLHNNIIVWDKIKHPYPSTESRLILGSDGNLCSSYKPDHESICIGSNGLGGVVLNLLPSGSYGREWGMVIQNAAGKMIWGIWGRAISVQGNVPLIPGNFIDRLDPDNSQLSPTPKSYITSGSDYLVVNPLSGNAIGFYRVNPVARPSNLIWSKASSSSSPYRLFFKNSTNEVCVGLVSNASDSIWCNGVVGKSQRYVVVPLSNRVGLSIDSGYWAWVTLNDNKEIVYTEASRPSAVFNKESIPLTSGASTIVTNQNNPYIFRISPSIKFQVGDLELRMESDGLKLVNTVTQSTLWQPYTISPPDSTASATFGIDGNLCIINPNKNLFCTYSQNIGGFTSGFYLNLLPQGSYGREWALIIQNGGRMVWGRFGKAINNRGIIPLIPGNFIDRQHPIYNSLVASTLGRNFITNGRDQLIMGAKTEEALGFYLNQNVWSGVSTTTHTSAFKVDKKITSAIYSLNFDSGGGNLCVRPPKGDGIWCNMFTDVDQRYLVIPVCDDIVISSHWAFSTFDSNMKLIYAKVAYIVSGTVLTQGQTAPNSMSNQYSLFENNGDTGVITYKNRVDNSMVAQFKPSNLNSKKSLINRRDPKQPRHSFVFQLERETYDFRGAFCLENIHRIAMEPRLSNYHGTTYDVAYIGYNYFLPELLLLTENGDLIASPQIYDNTIYEPKY